MTEGEIVNEIQRLHLQNGDLLIARVDASLRRDDALRICRDLQRVIEGLGVEATPIVITGDLELAWLGAEDLHAAGLRRIVEHEPVGSETGDGE